MIRPHRSALNGLRWRRRQRLGQIRAVVPQTVGGDASRAAVER